MGNNVMKSAWILAFTLLSLEAGFAQKPSVSIVGVGEAGNEIPSPTITVAPVPTTHIMALSSLIVFEENSQTLPRKIATLSAQQAKTYKLERVAYCTDCSGEVLNIIGKRMATTPQENLVLLEQDAALKRSAAISEYLRTVWGIAPERITAKAQKNIPKNTVEILSDALLKPLLGVDTMRTATPPIIRFYSTAPAREENAAQWSISIKQDGIALRSPISAAGNIKPIVDWKINKEKNTIPPGSKPLKISLEIRYPTIANERSEVVEVPVNALTTRATHCDIILPFSPSETNCSDAHKAALNLARERGVLQATSKIAMRSNGALSSVPPGTPLSDSDKKQAKVQETLVAQRLKAVEKALGASITSGTVQPISVETENCVIIHIENPIP